jgi:phage terminase large subunit
MGVIIDSKSSILKSLYTDKESNTDRITFVGSEFVDHQGYWKIDSYESESDQYYIRQGHENTSPLSEGWVCAKWLRRNWLSGNIKILGEWWLPK